LSQDNQVLTGEVLSIQYEKSENGKTLFEWLAFTLVSSFPRPEKFSALVKKAVESGICFHKAEHDGRTLLHIASDVYDGLPGIEKICISNPVTIILEQIPHLN
jgi:hypothetical protein